MSDFGPLAVDGGDPVRKELLPYARQTIDDDDIAAVVEVLRSPWLTTGPLVEEFEKALAEAVGTRHAVAVSSGTAALHAAVAALGIGAGDEENVRFTVVFERGTEGIDATVGKTRNVVAFEPGVWNISVGENLVYGARINVNFRLLIASFDVAEDLRKNC